MLDKPASNRDSSAMITLIQVAIGGAIGASARYLAGLAAVRLFGAGFPWGTMFVNVAGSFAMGVLFIVLGQHSARLSPLLMTGLLGGFTTFSAFSLDAVKLFERGDTVLAAAYVAASVVLSIAALIAGITFARGMTA